MSLSEFKDCWTVNSGYSKVRPCNVIGSCVHFNVTKTTPNRLVANLSKGRVWLF